MKYKGRETLDKFKDIREKICNVEIYLLIIIFYFKFIRRAINICRINHNKIYLVYCSPRVKYEVWMFDKLKDVCK